MTFTKEDLKRFQAEPLRDKVQRSLAKIGEWFCHWNDNVYVAFSGGKDSTVLADLCALWCKLTGATLYLVFVNTGLEYPEIQKFVKEYAEYLRKKHGINVELEIIRPKMRFDEVIKAYGYPLISKETSKVVSAAKRLDSKFGDVARARLSGTHKMKDGNVSMYNCSKYEPLLECDFDISDVCCSIMKKKPSHDYAKRTGRKAMTATMADKSRLRTQQWLMHGCNGFDLGNPTSNPMSFWTEQDVLWYIKEESLPYASVYGDIIYEEEPEQMRLEDFGIFGEERPRLTTSKCKRTGCIFCAFGCHLEKEPTRFQLLRESHPKQYKYCIGGGAYDENGVWKPNENGLGMGHVFDECNKIYGDDFIKY